MTRRNLSQNGFGPDKMMKDDDDDGEDGDGYRPNNDSHLTIRLIRPNKLRRYPPPPRRKLALLSSQNELCSSR